jgi:pimeloyl-ACP methyl ester carboxylesterase
MSRASAAIVGVAVTLAASCTPDIDDPPPGTPPATVEGSVVLGRGSLVVGEQSTEYELVRLGREDGRATYVQWVRPLPADRGHASVVVQTLPYEGVDWSGDPVDEALAAAGPRSDGFYNDSACDDDNERGVAYFAVSPEESATNAITHVLNGHGTLLVFGRYYACDAIDGDVLDMRAALRFLAQRADDGDEVDVSRVGIIGNSWGGFLALYGAVRAPDEVVPTVVVPINPPAVMARMYDGIAVLRDEFPHPEQLTFFDSYLHRIEASTGGPAGNADSDFSRFDVDDICAGLRGKHTLLLHDSWDTLVPFAGSEELVATCGADSDVQGLWWRRQGAVDYEAVGLDHGLLGKEPGYPSVFTLSTSYLYAHLNDAAHPIVTFASRGGLQAFLQVVHDDQAAGGDVNHARVRVVEAMTPGALVLLVDENAGASADAVWADAVNAVWGTALDAAGLRAQLATGFPAP